MATIKPMGSPSIRVIFTNSGFINDIILTDYDTYKPDIEEIRARILEAKYIKKCRYVADINDLEDMDDGDPIPGGIPGPEKDKTGRYYLI